MLAKAVGPSARVIGIDSSQEMVEQACKRAEGLSAVEVELGGVHTLPLDDVSIDRAGTDRVLQSVTDPA
ncbi:methyltransferase domain-containing protein [Streptomyces chartreusis]|uniref:methyltransferase domain-containing protein n=1 Tax=Streptomyces chartreusis TaxID=1969 RepID=UPI0036C08094